MDKLITKHHSLIDWDYRVGAYFEITNTLFVSPPTSLRTQDTGVGGKIEAIYLKEALAACVPDGQIITYFLMTDTPGGGLGVLYRVQDIVYITYPQDCYNVHVRAPDCRLRKFVGGAVTTIRTHNFVPALSALHWYRFRYTFYQIIQADFSRYLKHLIDWEVDGEWVNLIDYDDPLNLWADSEINRLGLNLLAQDDPRYNHADDTQIWERA